MYKANIVTATFNRINYSIKVLTNVRATASKNLPFLMTVVDNGSADGSKSALKELFNKKIIDNLILLPENIGVAKAQNLGWKLFEKYAVYYGKVDNDVIFHKQNWLDDIVSVLDNSPEIGALGYNCEQKNTYQIVDNGKVCYRWKGGNVGGACFFVSPSTKEKLGYWCEEYDKYGEEDADYGIRIMFAGLRNAYMTDEELMEHLPESRNEYRIFKDQQRADNLKGKFNEVYNGYHSKTRSLKVESNIDKEVNNYEIYSHLKEDK